MTVKRYQGRNRAKEILIGGKRRTYLGVGGKPGQANNTEYKAPSVQLFFFLFVFSPCRLLVKMILICVEPAGLFLFVF